MNTIRNRRGVGTTPAIKAAVRTMPARPSLELYGTIHTPREYRPLLRPDGPFYGSGV